jgi:hypothetical protein
MRHLGEGLLDQLDHRQDRGSENRLAGMGQARRVEYQPGVCGPCQAKLAPAEGEHVVVVVGIIRPSAPSGIAGQGAEDFMGDPGGGVPVRAIITRRRRFGAGPRGRWRCR